MTAVLPLALLADDESVASVKKEEEEEEDCRHTHTHTESNASFSFPSLPVREARRDRIGDESLHPKKKRRDR